MNGWSKTQLNQIADVIDSLHKTPKYSDIGYPMVRVTDVFQGFLRTENCLKVSIDIFNEFSKNHSPKKGDIIFSRVGSEGRTALVVDNTNFCLGQNTAFISPKNDNNFLYYWLNSSSGRAQIKKKTTGASQRTISLKSMRELEINLPSREEQDKLSNLISRYDFLIENNQERTRILEEMAQRLYTEWFVNFKLPGHKGVKMIDSETDFGMIPEGWRVEKIEDIADVMFGFNFKSKSFSEDAEGNKVVRIRDILSGDTKTFSKQEVDGKYEIFPSDLLIGMDGIFHMSIWFIKGCYQNQRVARIRSGLSSLYMKLAVRDQLDILQKTIKGATVGHLSNGNIRSFNVLVPQKDLLGFFKDSLDQMGNLYLQNKNLSKMRDILIESLVTGKRLLKN